MFLAWLSSRGWHRLTVSLLISQTPLRQLKKLRVLLSRCADSKFIDIPGKGVAPWSRLRVLLVCKYWICIVADNIHTRKLRQHQGTMDMELPFWRGVLSHRTFWLIPSPGGSGMRNYLRLSVASRPMMRLVARMWRTGYQQHPSLKRLVDASAGRPWNSLPVLGIPQRRVIFVMCQRMRYDEPSGEAADETTSGRSGGLVPPRISYLASFRL